MPTHKLNNYLRAHRKRAGLTQREVAFLLGLKARGPVSELEKRRRVPLLRTAMTLEAIFGIPVSELFPGMRQAMNADVEKRITEFATLLKVKVDRKNDGPQNRAEAGVAFAEIGINPLAMDLATKRVLALDLRPRSFGFVVFEGREELLDCNCCHRLCHESALSSALSANSRSISSVYPASSEAKTPNRSNRTSGQKRLYMNGLSADEKIAVSCSAVLGQR
jgi:transcriptional regulator with XRE-family HTH domain